MRVAIYNDTFIARRPHFGCELVMTTFREQLDRVGIELVGTVKDTHRETKPFLGSDSSFIYWRHTNLYAAE